MKFSAAAAVAVTLALSSSAGARDDGRYSGSELKSWFDKLSSDKGMCCSFADGVSVDDPDVDTAGDHYRVRVDGTWFDVPDAALVTEPNRYGLAVVWPYRDFRGKMQIRCFLPGSGA